jgi:cytochrome c peroxidase
MKTAVGIEGQVVRRNAPTIYNVAYLERLFYDGRELSLENQVWSPLLAGNEMGNTSVGAVIQRIRAIPDYDGLFESTFNRGPGMETIGMALASYERALLSARSPFDRWLYGRQPDALEGGARRGFVVFTGKGKCAECHLVGKQYALFTDNSFHNTGVGYSASMGKMPATTRLPVAPGRQIEVVTKSLDAMSVRSVSDLGRYEFSGDPIDRWKYRTPSLRNIDLTAPYMHDGSVPTLEEVVRFYDRGGIPNETLDPVIGPLHLSVQEIQDLVLFLEALTGDNVVTLVSDAYAAPVGGS